MPDLTDPRQIVADGYDLIADRYAQWVAREVVDQVRTRYTTLLLERLPRGAAILEIGCGGGGPTTQKLAERFALTGVDISARQIDLARQNVPHATFIHADVTRLELAPASFEGVAAFYTLTHFPYGELPQVIDKIGTWLRPGGVLVATLSARADSGTIEPAWLGAPMYFSGYRVEDNRSFVERAGLQIESARIETILEDGQPVQFLWVVAKKPSPDPEDPCT